MSMPPNQTTANKQVGGVTFTIGDDPRDTARIEESAVREIQRRLRELRGRVREKVGYESDALNQSHSETTDGFDASGAGATLLTAEFIRWFQSQLRDIFGLAVGLSVVQNGGFWFSEFLENAVEAGVNQSTGLLFQAGVDIENIPTPEILDRFRFRSILTGQTGRYQSAFDELTDLADDLTNEVRTIVREGLAEDKTPREIADAINAQIAEMERTRATTIARTEVAVAHTESALENYQKAGVNTVGHVGRVTAGDASVCAFCRRIRDEVFTIDEFRDVVVQWRGKVYRVGIPGHPAGRCLVVPRTGIETGALDPLTERVPGTIINR